MAKRLKRSRLEYLEIYTLKANNLSAARQRKEVQIKPFTRFNQECFRKAMKKEIDNNIKTGAYKALNPEEPSRIRKQCPEKIMESRYVSTAKPSEPLEMEPAKHEEFLLDWDTSGPCKATVQRVMKGFSEQGAELLDSTTPQVTREGVL